jgi:hypothetical protein
MMNDDLQRQLYIRLSPLVIENPDTQLQSSITLRQEPLSIQPTKKNIGRVGKDMFGAEDALVHFVVSERAPAIVRQFLSRNFGFLDQHRLTTFVPGEVPQGISRHVFEIDDYISLNNALMELPARVPKAIFPGQICTIPNTFKDGYCHEHNFTVIVGDSIEDIVYSWNRTLSLDAWMRYDLTHIWLPTELAANEAIRPGLARFLNHWGAKRPINNDHTVRFVSLSIEDGPLTSIARALNGAPWPPCQRLRQLSVPENARYSSLPPLKRSSDMFRAHSNREYLSVGEPDIERGVMAGEHWFVDLTIQFRPQGFVTNGSMQHWWRLPRRNGLLRDLSIFGAQAARINEYGTFSVLMSRSSAANQGASLSISLPAENAIFDKLLCGERYDYFRTDEPGRFMSREFHASKFSDKGQYLVGLLSLWPDLYNAGHLFETVYWRRIFARMSNHDLAKDPKRLEVIIRTLTKAIRQDRDFRNSSEDINWLAKRVLLYAKDYSQQEIELSYSQLWDEARMEVDVYNASSIGNRATLTENEFRDILAELVEAKILLPGIRPKCVRCGYRIWRHIDDVTQELQCQGCNFRFSISIEERWYYRLNSLIRVAVTRHGTIPLLLVLAQLMSEARSAFMFAPCTELLKQDGDNDQYRSYQEIDLLCIKDGNFIIGEIKQSVELFNASDFYKIEEMAVRVKPNIVLFASLDEQPNGFVLRHITTLRSRLASLDIDVIWYQLNHSIFRTQPIV